MRLVGEVYRLPCPHCKQPVQIVLEPHSNCVDPKILPEDTKIPEHILRTSTFRCNHCDYPIIVLGKLIFVVGDVDEFDYIEQHK